MSQKIENIQTELLDTLNILNDVELVDGSSDISGVISTIETVANSDLEDLKSGSDFIDGFLNTSFNTEKLANILCNGTPAEQEFAKSLYNELSYFLK